MGHWKQIIDGNWRIPYVGGWCEGYVEGAYGKATLPSINNQRTSGVYASAMDAWNKSQGKHTDYPPAGITVPVFFSLGSTSYGHVAIRLDDLMVASSTQAGFHNQGYIHPNIQNMINMFAQYNNGCSYLGWSEFVGGTRVVEYVPDITYKDITTETVIPFVNENKDNPELEIGQTRIIQAGINGKHILVTTQTLSDGVVTAKTVKTDQTIPAVNQITAIGTKPLITEKDKEQDVKLLELAQDHSFIERVKALLQTIINFFVKLKG